MLDYRFRNIGDLLQVNDRIDHTTLIGLHLSTGRNKAHNVSGIVISVLFDFK